MLATEERDEWYARTIDEILVYLGCSTGPSGAGLSGFGDALLTSRSLVDEMIRRRAEAGLDTAARACELSGPWDVTTLYPASSPGHRYLLTRCGLVAFPVKQRLLRLGVLPRWCAGGSVCRVDSAKVGVDGRFAPSRFYAAYNLGQNCWMPVTGFGKSETRRVMTGAGRKCREGTVTVCTDERVTVAGLAVNHAWLLPRCWRVRLSYQSGPGVVLVTDAVGARELFRQRDVPEGRDRRDALLHWVREHWRRNRFCAEEEVLVRQHLRGQSEFVWYGMRCRLQASDDDVRGNEEIASRRQAMGVVKRPRAAAAVGQEAS